MNFGIAYAPRGVGRRNPRSTSEKKHRGFFWREGAALEGGSERVLIVTRRKGIKKLQRAKECEMQSTDVYLGLLRERGKRGLPLNRVYRQLFNRNLYLTAYGKIYQIWTARPLTPLHALFSTLTYILTKNEESFVLGSVAYLWRK